MNSEVQSTTPARRFAISLGIAMIALTAALPAHATNLVLNGSFETNSAGSTSFNLSNAGLTGLVSNVTGYGTAQEIDLVQNGDFGLAPQDGNWKLGLHAQTFGAIDAFSSPLVPLWWPATPTCWISMARVTSSARLR